MLLLLITIIGSCGYVYIKPFKLHHSFFDRPFADAKWIDNTWVQFLDCCSGDKIIENQVHAMHQFS